MRILLLGILLFFSSPAPLMEKGALLIDNEVTDTEEESEEENENRADTTLENTLIGSGVGLVAVGGIGAGIIAHNNAKPKNVPTNLNDNGPNDQEKKRRLK